MWRMSSELCPQLGLGTVGRSRPPHLFPPPKAVSFSGGKAMLWLQVTKLLGLHGNGTRLGQAAAGEGQLVNSA